MDKASFARKWPPATADQSDVGELAMCLAGAPAEDEEIDEIKSAVLAKLALDLGKDASVATERDWFIAGSRWSAPTMPKAASASTTCRWSSSSGGFWPMCSGIWVVPKRFARHSG